MINEMLEILKSWNVIGQFIFAVIISILATFVALALIGMVGDFINSSLPTIIRGHPEQGKESNITDESNE
jgi:hypothetical protein